MAEPASMPEEDIRSDSRPVDPVIHPSVMVDDDAFCRLLEETAPVVYRFLVRMVGSPEEAMDLAQEVSLAAHRNRSRLRAGSPALPYFLTIARRKAISFLRWRAVRSIVLPLSDRHAEVLPGREGTPRDRADERQQHDALAAAVSTLKPAERTAVVLRLFEERSYDEVARIMEKPLGTVKSLVFRAEKKIRRELEKKQAAKP